MKSSANQYSDAIENESKRINRIIASKNLEIISERRRKKSTDKDLEEAADNEYNHKVLQQAKVYKDQQVNLKICLKEDMLKEMQAKNKKAMVTF